MAVERLERVKQLVADNAARYVDWLTEACSIPSLAGDARGVVEGAEWVESKLISLGATTSRLTFENAPDSILGVIGTGDPAVLVYDHYDVQPVDPIELWDSQPFQPQVRDGRFYARGAADNKGDLVARLAALDVYQQIYGDLPITVKFLVEGEEETGSGSFDRIVETYADQLRADGCIWEGTGVDFDGTPQIVFGAKGLAYVELTYSGLADDQHSSLAVVAPSPVWHMVEALATLRTPDGRVHIDGFYDDVREPDAAALEMIENLPFDEEAELKRLGVDHFVGNESGLDLKKRYYFQPTCNIAGIVAGFTVPGASKTVLPKQAMVKIDFRLVPDQDPRDIVSKLRSHLDRHGFGDIEVTEHGLEPPVLSDFDSAIGRAALDACDGVFDREPAPAPLMIGTGPMHVITSTLEMPIVSPAGVHNPNSNIHAPNEHCRVDDYLKVIEYTVAWLRRFGEINP